MRDNYDNQLELFSQEEEYTCIPEGTWKFEEAIPEYSLCITDHESKNILTVKLNGEIIWRDQLISDHKLLAIAFMDVITNSLGNNYNYNLLDPEIYEEYMRFLRSNEL